MQQFLVVALSGLFFLAGKIAVSAQTARIEVRAIAEEAPASRMPEMVRKGTRTETLAPKLRLEAAISGSGAAPFNATLEWYVIGRMTPQAQNTGRAAAGGIVVMQSSRETVTVKPAPGAKTSFFAYAPGQVRDGAEGLGWLVRLVGADGRLLDARGSGVQFVALARDQARLTALVNAKQDARGTRAEGEADLPLELVARIKADAEKNWPGNPEMQAFEIKNKLEHHKQAYRK